MSLINGLLALLGEIESDAIAVHEERCISVRNRHADCLRCVEACTSGALAYRAGELLVEPERCIGCGTCATACPTCAIELRNPTDAELTAQLKHSIVATKGHPVIVCEQALEAANRKVDFQVIGAEDLDARKAEVGQSKTTSIVEIAPGETLPSVTVYVTDILSGISADGVADVVKTLYVSDLLSKAGLPEETASLALAQ